MKHILFILVLLFGGLAAAQEAAVPEPPADQGPSVGDVLLDHQTSIFGMRQTLRLHHMLLQVLKENKKLAPALEEAEQRWMAAENERAKRAEAERKKVEAERAKQQEKQEADKQAQLNQRIKQLEARIAAAGLADDEAPAAKEVEDETPAAK